MSCPTACQLEAPFNAGLQPPYPAVKHSEQVALCCAHLSADIHDHMAPPVLRHLPHRRVLAQAAVVVGRRQLRGCEGDDAQDLAGCGVGAGQWRGGVWVQAGCWMSTGS